MKYLFAIAFAAALSALAAFTPVGIVILRLSEKLPVLLAVLLAAVFVRLARGMPTIPYDKVAETKAKNATRAFRALINSYVHTFAIFIIAIILNLSVSLIKVTELSSLSYDMISAALAFIDGAVVGSIAFLVQSDVLLARIQADMMDEVTATISAKAANQSASNVRSAFNIRQDETPKITPL